MKTLVTIKETLVRCYVVDKADEDEAYDIINNAISSEEIVLTDDDYSDREIETENCADDAYTGYYHTWPLQAE